jgi:sulfide:quinone oxidoreductase
MKCAGAPLKHTFLIDDIARRAGNRGKCRDIYAAPQGSLFGVPIVAKRCACCSRIAASNARCMNVLKAIDAGASAPPSNRRRRHREGYDYLHVIPPQRAPEFVRAVGPALGRQAGPTRAGSRWTPQTLRHLRYPNIFALGDVAGVPKGKTAASVKWQVPVVEDHLVAAIEGREGTETYNGYTSCPLITRIGRAMLIEFDYNNNLTPSFPGIIAPLEELWISWLMKEVALKATYNAMLRGMA